jgi:hypothetical protein
MSSVLKICDQLFLLLHDEIDQEECRPQNVTHEIFVKCGQNKFMPVSFLRKVPGTIFK